jgi:Spy/CpxP family protein refolding chaperone
MKTKHSLFLITGLAAALVATTAVSAPRMARGDAMLPPTAAELGLSSAHAQSWDALRADAVALRQVGRDDLVVGMREFRSLLDRPSPDLRAFSAESQRKVDAHIAEARALRDRQLDLYESLSPDEQARVRAAMAERLDRFSRLRERLAGLIATTR